LHPKYLALCINKGKYLKILGELNLTPDIDTDMKLFQKIKEKYLELREFRAKFWLLIPTAVHYVYVSKTTPFTRKPGSSSEMQVSVDNSHQVGIIDEPLALPPKDEVEAERYHYDPCPWKGGKPVPNHIFMHMLDCPDPSSADAWMSRLPKKLKTSITYGTSAMSYGWGVHIDEGPNWAAIAWLNLLVLGLSGVAAGLWKYFENDFQGAFGFASWIVVVLDSVLGVYFFKWERE
jgi:hypothetical protein